MVVVSKSINANTASNVGFRSSNNINSISSMSTEERSMITDKVKKKVS